MSRIVSLAILAIISLSSFRVNNYNVNSGELDGVWSPVRQELGGKPLPESMLKGQKMVIKGSHCSVTANPNDNSTIKYGGGKLDIYGGDVVNKNKHFTGIYKFVDGQLYLTLDMLGKGYPANYQTAGKEGELFSVFKKQK